MIPTSYYEDEYSTMWLEDGIMYQRYKPNLVITFEIAKKMVEARLKLSDGVIRPVLVDIRNLVSIDSAARKYFASRDAVKQVSAGAIYLDNYLTRLAGNIFLMIDKPLVPAKLFTHREKALRWLEPFKYIN